MAFYAVCFFRLRESFLSIMAYATKFSGHMVFYGYLYLFLVFFGRTKRIRMAVITFHLLFNTMGCSIEYNFTLVSTRIFKFSIWKHCYSIADKCNRNKQT